MAIAIFVPSRPPQRAAGAKRRQSFGKNILFSFTLLKIRKWRN